MNVRRKTQLGSSFFFGLVFSPKGNDSWFRVLSLVPCILHQVSFFQAPGIKGLTRSPLLESLKSVASGSTR